MACTPYQRPGVGVVLSGGLSDVVLRELWKLVCYWRVHSVKADCQSTVPHKETTYTYLASFQRAERARRGDDARAERCLRVWCDKTALWSVLGFHVVDFPLVLPDRETSRPRPESTIWVITRQRWVLV